MTLIDDLTSPEVIHHISSRIRRAARSDELYEILAPWDCGAFDGGCLMVADALRKLFGVGELVGLMGYAWVNAQRGGPTEPHWQHALLQLGDYFLDGDGVSTRQTLRRRWYRDELTYITGFMVMPDIDPLDEFEIASTYTIYRHTTVASLVEHFRRALLT
jgi:hypothetical protein